MDYGLLGKQNSDYEEPDCPCCGSNHRKRLYQSQKRTGTQLGDISVTVSQCMACGFVYNSPRVSTAKLATFYANSPLASGQIFRDESVLGYYPKLNSQRARFLNKFIKMRPNGRLLDIGCGVAGFLDALKAHKLNGWSLCGLEPSQNAQQICVAKGYDVIHADLDSVQLTEHTYDVITMISVLEHMPNPKDALARIYSLLKPDGLVLIEVPNTLWPELSLSGFFSLEHIVHFTPYSLSTLFKSFGWGECQNDPGENGHALRLAGSANMLAWGVDDPVKFEPDAERVAEVLSGYTKRELHFLEMLRRTINSAFDEWRDEKRTVAIYGAGVHTASLTMYFDLLENASYMLDGDPKKHGTEFMGMKVHAPEEITALGINAVLVSSQRFQDEIVRKIREVSGADVKIAVCYDDSNNSFGNSL